MNTNSITVINAKVFDGVDVLHKKNVVFKNGQITGIMNELPADTKLIDGQGCTLLPGLIDAHVHTSEDSLREAILFGITTELEMQGGGVTKTGRAFQLKNPADIADVRSAGMAITAPGGHPDELIPKENGVPSFILKKIAKMTEDEKEAYFAAFEKRSKEGVKPIDLTTVEGAIQFVRQQVYHGADFIKVMIEEGTVMNAPGLPMLKTEIMKAAVDEAHRLQKLVIAHVLTAEAARTAIDIGVDGLAHLFIDRPSWTPDLIKSIVSKGLFVTPCLVLNSSIIGTPACHLAQDDRVAPKLSDDWKITMCSCFNTFPAGKMEDSLKNAKDLFDAGVDILVGTDVSVPMAHLGGLAHGVSVHHEMQLLVQAGLRPIDALRAATSITAKRFNLSDRGKIEVGRRADLVLVKGDPTLTIADSLSVARVWKEGREISLVNNLL